MAQWHHSPVHLFAPNSFYFVTAGTLHKRHLFDCEQKLELLQNTFFECAEAFHWAPQAWAFFSNHYHFVAHAPDEENRLKQLLQRLHSQTARELNRIDGMPGRSVWFQYRDTCLTYEASYLARLHYVHYNPIKHGVVPVAENYRFCSAKWFASFADAGFRRKVLSFGIERLNVEDDF